MKDEDKIEVFKKWIIDSYGKDTWNEFKDNLKNDASYKSLSEFVSNLPLCFFVVHAFTWQETKQSDYYWNKINDKWQKHCEEKGYDKL